MGGDSQARSRRWPFDCRTAQQRGAGRQPVAYQLSPNERQLLRKLPFLFWLWRTHSPKSLLKEWTGRLGSKAQRIDFSARELGEQALEFAAQTLRILEWRLTLDVIDSAAQTTPRSRARVDEQWPKRLPWRPVWDSTLRTDWQKNVPSLHRAVQPSWHSSRRK